MTLIQIVNATSHFLNTYPICPPPLIAMLTFGLFPIILLIYLIQKTAVHSNCRYLITMWCLSFCGMFASYYGIVFLNIISDKGYFPSSMFEPAARQQFYSIHAVFFLCCSAFEAVIAIERIISSINPMQYYNRSFAMVPQAIVTTLIVFIAVFHCFLVYGDDHKSIASTIFVVLDTGTVWLNFYAVRYCNRRYEELYGKAELNARYQVKEAHTMAVAMKPVYIASYVIKFSVNFTCIFFFMFESLFTSLTGYIEASYICVMSINGGLTSALLIRNHPRIKMRFDEAKNNILCRTSRVTPDLRPTIDTVEESNTRSIFSMSYDLDRAAVFATMAFNDTIESVSAFFTALITFYTNHPERPILKENLSQEERETVFHQFYDSNPGISLILKIDAFINLIVDPGITIEQKSLLRNGCEIFRLHFYPVMICLAEGRISSDQTLECICFMLMPELENASSTEPFHLIIREYLLED